MKKKIFLIVGVLEAVALLAVCAGIIHMLLLMFSHPSDESLIREIFGISKGKYEYEIVSVENTLKHLEYDGSYMALVNVKEENVNKLVAELEGEDSYHSIKEKNEEEDIERTVEFYTGTPYEDSQKVYISYPGIVRTIETFPAKHHKKNIPERLVVCYPAVDGVCKVFFAYNE